MNYYSTASGFLILPSSPDPLPEGHAEITKSQWLRANGVTEADEIREQMRMLEAEYIAPRWQREFAMGVMQSMATPEQLAVNYGYKAVKALDDQIAALRAQLEAL